MTASRIFVDTNVWFEATVRDRKLHDNAVAVLEHYPRDGVELLTSGQVIREFFSVATRPSDKNGVGMSPGAAIEAVRRYKLRTTFLPDNLAVSALLEELALKPACRGKQIHDANIAATAIYHGASALLTANPSDFRRFADRIEIQSLASVKP